MTHTCKTCTKYCYCWERDRMYPCTIYESMYRNSRDSEVTGDEEIDNVCDTADDSLFVGGNDLGSICMDKNLKEVV